MVDRQPTPGVHENIAGRMKVYPGPSGGAEGQAQAGSQPFATVLGGVPNNDAESAGAGLSEPCVTPPPPQAQVVVTDRMVIAAGDILIGHVNASEQAIYRAARLALEAALALPPQTREVGRD